MAKLILSDLPVEHPLRNKPLIEIGAEYRWRLGSANAWKHVKPSYGIAQSTYNDLAPAWTDFDIWVAPNGQ